MTKNKLKFVNVSIVKMGLMCEAHHMFSDLNSCLFYWNIRRSGVQVLAAE